MTIMDKKIREALLLLIIPSMIAATFVVGATMLDMSPAYAQGNACKDQSNPQGKFNSNPFCPDEQPETVDEPPIPNINSCENSALCTDGTKVRA